MSAQKQRNRVDTLAVRMDNVVNNQVEEEAARRSSAVNPSEMGA